MTIRVAINGFGRIGRLTLRAIIESGRTDIKVVAINDTDPMHSNAHLLKYDSVHGRFAADISHDEDSIIVNGDKIHFTSNRNPEELPWAEHKIDIVMECTGIFKDRESAGKHIKAGAKKVLISAPGKGDIFTVVYGVNHKELRAEHDIVSNASCTTNCLAPVAKTLHEAVGIKHGFMTTIHSYTGDQRLVDATHRDLHRARAAALSMIPTSTGAAIAVCKVLPELNGKLDGVSIRVPTPNVSLVDFKFTANRETNIEELQSALKKAAENELKGVMDVYDLPLVSSDFNHDSHSSIVSLADIKIVEKTFCRVMAWYDNEWAFSNRMADTAKAMFDAK